jgi:hypothetical protein
MRALRMAFAFLAVFATAQGAQALSFYDFGFGLEVGGVTVQDGLDGLPVIAVHDPTTNTNGYILTSPVGGAGWTINSWSSAYDVDPFVTNNISLTNNSGVPQAFVISVAIPIPAFNYDRAIFSSVGITATDSNGNGSLSVSSLALFEGQVNGGTVLSLLDPLSLTQAACSFPGGPGCSATTSEGIASLLLPPGSATLIGIKLAFTLSPGDSIGITSRFEIIPEPGTMLLLGTALAGLAVRRRLA